MPSHDDRVDDFLRLYNELDVAMRQRLEVDRSVSHAALIERLAKLDSVFGAHASRLQAYRSLRNSLVHLSYPGETEPIAVPRPDVVEDYRQLIEYVKCPPTALESIAVREVFTVGWGDCVLPKLRHMMERGFRLAPITGNGKLEGMFTESTLAQAWLSSVSFKLDETVRFEAFRGNTHFSESILGVRLMSSEITVEEIERNFREAFERGEFTSVVCLTSTGQPFEQLDGIVTAHDLPSASGFSSMT